MREMYTQELAQLGNQMARMGQQVARAMRRASHALEQGDIALAEQTIDADERINEMANSVDDLCMDLLARQAPVAGDLRLIVTGLRMTQTLERMGDLARNIAAIARQAFPASTLPIEVQGCVEKMGAQGRRVGEQIAALLENPNTEAASQLQSDDDIMDDLHVELRRLVNNPDIELTRTQIIDLTLMGRYYERYGDHATKVGRHLIYLIEGQRWQNGLSEH